VLRAVVVSADTDSNKPSSKLAFTRTCWLVCGMNGSYGLVWVSRGDIEEGISVVARLISLWNKSKNLHL
jgi:hypothetical protein